jgi:hypothetical protein
LETLVIEKEINVLPSKDVRGKILDIEAKIASMPSSTLGDRLDCPLKHIFVDGAYVREIFMPKGLLIISKIHKITHPYFVLKGECSVLTEEGIVRIKAPFSGVTKSGTKRILYIHEDCTWTTVHVTKETDIEKIEEEIIAKTFNDLPDKVIDTEAEIMDFIEEVKKGEANENTLA